MRKTRLTIIAGIAGGALSLATITAASATPATHAAGPVGQHKSVDLAGYSLDGNGATVFDGIWRGLNVPPEPSTVTPDTVVDGVIMANNVSVGGTAYGMGLVLNDNVSTNSCGLGFYTLEAGTGLITLPTQPTLPATDLSPLLYFGSPICISGATGGSEFVYEYNSHRAHEVDFSAGPNSHNWNVLLTDHGFFGTMRTGGAGVMTTSGAVTSQLLTGNNFDGGGVGFFVNGQGNSVFGQGWNMAALNYDSWQACQLTVNCPSLSNQYTLNTSPLTTLVGGKNFGGQYSEVVP